MMIDNGRGHFNYGVAYFWVLIMTKTSDGRPVFINLSDGIGSEYKNLDKASEDFIVIGDRFFKLDVSALEYYKDNYYSKKRAFTAEGDSTHYKKAFPNRGCDLSFEPVEKFDDGVNAGLIAFKQHLIYGYFTGHCFVEEERVEIQKAYGHVEHVMSRW